MSINVSVPAGICNGNTLRLQGMGHYAGSVFGMSDQYSDAFCHITVTEQEGLSVQNEHVISHLDISLLDALKGCSKSVDTIFGEKNIDIPSQSKNKDEIIIPHLGIAEVGDQKVILNIQYPSNIDALIEMLSKE